MYLVGLTGGIATGKSTVKTMLGEMEIHVIDADEVAREVVEPGTKAWKKIHNVFGPSVFTSSGELNRVELGKIIFANPEERRKLNSITHPAIYKAIFWKCSTLLLKGYQFVVLDLPLLYESGKMVPFMTKVIVVTCNNEQQINRLMSRNDFNVEEAEARIGAQLPLTDKCYRADFVIDNSGDLEQTRKQVEKIVFLLRACSDHWKIRLLFWGSLSIIGGCISWGLYSTIAKYW